MYDLLGNYGFEFFGEISSPPISLKAVGIEKRSSGSYYYNNLKRSDCYLFQYTFGGTGTVVIDGVARVLEPGQAFFLKMPGNEAYYFDEKTNKAPWHFIYIMFKGAGVAEYYEVIKKKVGNVISLQTDSSAVLALTEIFRLASVDMISDQFTSERLVFDFLCRLCTECCKLKSEHTDTVVKAIGIMSKEFAVIGGVSDVAQRLDVTLNHLSRVFTAEMHMTPIVYLTKIRLQEAVNLLLLSELSVNEIAIRCGFLNGNYFCKVFRKYLRISPLVYRKQMNCVKYDNIKI